MPDFSTFFERVKKATPIQNQSQLAQELELGRAAISLAKHKNVVPSKWIFTLSRKYGVNADWLATGSGPMTTSDDTLHLQSSGIVHILPRLTSDGAPILKTESQIKDSFPDMWLDTHSTSSRLALMTMAGNCMEPEIKPGDRVLIDLDARESYSDCIYAVGIDQHILIRRIERMPGQLVLRCDNPHSADMVLSENEEAAVSIVGRIIWVGRHYQFL